MDAMLTSLTAQANQTEDLSWWPKSNAWESSGMNTGLWNQANEQWFTSRLQAIRDGRGKPMTSTKWRSALRKYMNAAKLANCSALFSDKAIDMYALHNAQTAA